MKAPDTLIVPCPLCDVGLVVSLTYAYPTRSAIEVSIDPEVLRNHVHGCAGIEHDPTE